MLVSLARINEIKEDIKQIELSIKSKQKEFKQVRDNGALLTSHRFKLDKE